MNNQKSVKISKFLHDESLVFVGSAEAKKPYSSLRNLVDDSLRAYLQDLKKQYGDSVK